jgi:hypothetical protein
LRIVNASLLILLTRIGRIDLLNADGVDGVVPMPVYQEVSYLDSTDPVVGAIQHQGWALVMPPQPSCVPVSGPPSETATKANLPTPLDSR